jgi:CBS domain-containing protein
MAMMRDILAVKGGHVHSVHPEASVLDAAELMNEHKIGGLVVIDDGRLVGIITERDILRRVVAQQRDAAHTAVSDVMTAEVACARPHTTVEEARGVMKNRRFRHLPVLDGDDNICGMVSIGDLNAHEAHDHEMTIHLLQEYISGHV